MSKINKSDFKEFQISWSKEPDFPLLGKCSTNLQDSNISSIIFYKLGKTENSEKLFKERLGNSKVGILFLNKEIEGDFDFPIAIVNEDEFLKLQKLICDKLYPLAGKLPKLVGITGTNGKSTVVHLCSEISKLNNKNTLTIGTLGVFLNGVQEELKLDATSPSFSVFREILFLYKDKVDVIYFEVSSHALEQERFFEIDFDLAGWTSFSQDHLDYHKNMDEYFRAKSLILKKVKTKNDLLLPLSQVNIIKKLEVSNKLVSAIPNEYKIAEVMKTGFNKDNLEISYNINKELWGGISFDISSVTPPIGRFSYFENNERAFIVDYAHTPAALENVLTEVRKSYPTKKILTIFGCGGDRDKSKRAEMGKISENLSDKSIVTTDNPRFEKREDIIEDILSGFNVRPDVEVDREKAIEMGFENTSEDWIILVAGKGHEEYIDSEGKKEFFSDIATVKKLLGLK